ncbi:hypothetical protein O181_017475 [Austropuccinia psidii MF-1]|uniref:Uncharacterized protein n=1 Tax=Austropuccinia psidii MF-1 TaxID=1389203 RepID=A0A9Q3GT21_9BASI|nr:hypothetical protein [Austropuccinia psidii MF-1]
MPFQHSPPARQKRSWAKDQAIFTPIPRAPLEGTPAVLQLRAHLDRGPIIEGSKRAKKINFILSTSFLFYRHFKDPVKGPGDDDSEEEDNSVE